jgi:hypothetical protein
MTFNRESIPSVSSSRETIIPPEAWNAQTALNWEATTNNWDSEAYKGFAKEGSYTSGISTQGFKLAFFSTVGVLPGYQYYLIFSQNLDNIASAIDVTAGTTDSPYFSKYIEASIKQGRFVFTGYNAGVYEIASSYSNEGNTFNTDTLYWLTNQSAGFYPWSELGEKGNTGSSFTIHVNQISGSTPSDIHSGGIPQVDEDDIMYLNADNHFLQDIDFKREN